jgi:hypothetical protein
MVGSGKLATEQFTKGQPIEADYLIIGAGAVGMAFADTLLSETQATIALVDRRHRPGGHWNDAYPYVRLHQPSAYYGVNSQPLGSGETDKTGLNKGFYELASGLEVLNHFDRVLRRRFLPSGRVQYFPMSDVGPDLSVSSLVSGERRLVKPRRVVDASYMKFSVPSERPPQYAVAAGVACAPPNDLPRMAHAYRNYVVVGAGKTGMDACVWLIENGADPDRIRWIMPRDYWLLDRAGVQPGKEFLAPLACSVADQVEALAKGRSVDDVFARLEACGVVKRIDVAQKPTAYHCAVIGEGELELLRRIRDIVRLGRVIRVDADQIVLERGAVQANRDCLYIDCSASGITTTPSKPVFEGNRITVQMVRLCQPTFSGALIAHIEAAYQDEAEKNRICTPVPPPDTPADWVRLMAIELANRANWAASEEIRAWQARARLDLFVKQIAALNGTETEVIKQLSRYGQFAAPAAANASLLSAS